MYVKEVDDFFCIFFFGLSYVVVVNLVVSLSCVNSVYDCRVVVGWVEVVFVDIIFVIRVVNVIVV